MIFKAPEEFAAGMAVGALCVAVLMPIGAFALVRYVRPIRDRARWAAERKIDQKVAASIAALQSDRTRAMPRAVAQAVLPIVQTISGVSFPVFVHNEVSGPAVGAVFEAFGLPNP